MSSIQLSRSLLQASVCRRNLLLRSIANPQWDSRRWLAEKAGSSTSSKVGKSSAEDASPEPVKTRKRRRTRAEMEAERTGTGAVKPATRGRARESFTPGWELPPIDQWRTFFKQTKESVARATIRNPETARMLAEALVPEGSKDKIIIDANPGPGQLTRALLQLPKERIKKIIIMEAAEPYLEFLRPLEVLDSRVSVYPWTGRDWDSYTKLSEVGALDDVEVVDWKTVHPKLQFIMHLPGTVDGEQLLAQLFRTMPDRQWLYQYGRVPINIILNSRMWERIKAPASTGARCKVSVMSQAAADFSESVPYDSLQPYSNHFHPQLVSPSSEPSKQGILDLRKKGSPHLAISCIPKVHQAIKPGDLDFWDYCLRKLFVQKATPLKKCINSLGPGAYNILPKLSDPSLPPDDRVDTGRAPRDMTVHEWANLVAVFKRWPFRPEDLAIDTFFIAHSKNR